MPRPKRSKVAPSAPITLRRVAQPLVRVPAAQKQKDVFSPTSSGRVTNGSDDSDGLVVARRAESRGKNAIPQEYTMSGALAPEDIGTTRLRPPSGKIRATLTRIAREADHAEAVENARARRAAQPVRTEPEQIQSSFLEESLLGGDNAIESSQSPARNNSHATLGSRIQETPRLQSSMLGGAMFKRRPRQPSLLQMVQSQNQVQDEVDDDDMYNFLPDDESTPLIKSLSQPRAHTISSSSRQTSGSRKRKQATPEIQVATSQSQSDNPHSSPSSIPPQPPEPLESLNLPAEEDEPQPTLPQYRSARTLETQTLQTKIHSDTLAPPQSSSPAKAQPQNTRRTLSKASNQLQSTGRPPKRKEPSTAPSPMSSTSTHISPVRPKPLKTLTTATLQNLLPRRRVRGKPKGNFDIPSSSDVELDTTGLGEDEDELSFHSTKVRRKRPSMTGQKSVAKRKETLAGKKASKTYTRKSVVVSEDEDDENGSASGDELREIAAGGRKKTPALDGRAKAEMKRLADKFKEVDDFTLEFEDMTGSSSQMRDAR